MTEKPNIDIDYVAHLARNELTSEKKAGFGSQLNDILDYLKKLKAVDVDGFEPMAHARPTFNVWREGDTCGPTYSPEVLQGMAPESRDNQVVVPKVVE